MSRHSPPVIGLAYDLADDYKSSNLDPEIFYTLDGLDTIWAINEAIRSLGFHVDRIGNIKHVVARLAKGDRWDLVFNMTAGIHGMAREAQVTALLEAYEIPSVFSAANTMVQLFDKSIAKMILKENGIPTAPFKIVNTLSEVDNVSLPYPLFAKPVAQCTGRGIDENSKVHTPEQLQAVCENLIQKYNVPVLVETFLPGREFTVGMLGTASSTRVIGIMEIIIDDSLGTPNYGLENKIGCPEHMAHQLLEKNTELDLWQAIHDISVATWRTFGCRDGGRLDIRCDENGKPHILEVNPLAGLKPGCSDLPHLADACEITYSRLIQEIVKNACDRCGIALPEKRKATARL